MNSNASKFGPFNSICNRLQNNHVRTSGKNDVDVLVEAHQNLNKSATMGLNGGKQLLPMTMHVSSQTDRMHALISILMTRTASLIS